MPSPAPLDQAAVREFALSLPGAYESSHFDRPDFRVANKIFATLPPDGRTVNLKITPLNLSLLVQSAPETFRDVWGGRYLGVELSRVDPDQLRDLITDAWRLAAPKRLAARKDGGR